MSKGKIEIVFSLVYFLFANCATDDITRLGEICFNPLKNQTVLAIFINNAVEGLNYAAYGVGGHSCRSMVQDLPMLLSLRHASIQ